VPVLSSSMAVIEAFAVDIDSLIILTELRGR